MLCILTLNVSAAQILDICNNGSLAIKQTAQSLSENVWFKKEVCLSSNGTELSEKSLLLGRLENLYFNKGRADEVSQLS